MMLPIPMLTSKEKWRIGRAHYGMPIVSVVGLLVIGGVMLSPSSINKLGIDGEVYAATGASSNLPDSTSNISLTSSKNSISNTASSINTTISDTTNLTVTANGTSQYAIYVQETQNGGKLVNGSSSLTQLSAERTYNNIDAGKWGYALAEGAGVSASGLTYKAVPSTSTTAAYTGTTASSKPFTLAFAAKFADSNAAGHYTGQVLVSVAANPGEVVELNFDDITYMQDLTPSFCEQVAIGSSKPLIDKRDYKSYWVTKMPDNNCWMMQDISYTGVGKKIYNATAWTTSTVSDATSAYLPSGRTAGANEDLHYLVGNYYSWTAATEVCPAGWGLPTGGNDSDFANLVRLTNGVYNNFNIAGYAYNGAVNAAANQGRYWTSTITSTNPYNFYVGGGSASLTDTGLSASAGALVRCIMHSQPQLVNAFYMKDVTSTTCGNSQENATKSLIDDRDDKTYWVAKMKDGNCWMTQNLDYNEPNGTSIASPSAWKSLSSTSAAYYDPGTKITNNSSLVDPSATTNPRQLVGNYYTHASATSACPAGWELPSGNSDVNNGSIGKLLASYGIVNNPAGSTTMQGFPLYFVRSGYLTSGDLKEIGSFGFYWTATTSGSSSAYNLFFNSDNVYPSDSDNKTAGFAVRCLVLGS